MTRTSATRIRRHRAGLLRRRSGFRYVTEPAPAGKDRMLAGKARRRARKAAQRAEAGHV